MLFAIFVILWMILAISHSYAQDSKAKTRQNQVGSKGNPIRGSITFIGDMPREFKGETKLVYGVQVTTENGTDHRCYGIDLKRAVTLARVGVGDVVDIAKIGQGVGKTPKNLWNITKVPKESE